MSPHKIVQYLVTLDKDLEAARQYLDSLPVGAIQLDKSGNILYYSPFESARSGRSQESVLGKNFFDVAPCLALQGLRQQFIEAVPSNSVDIEFEAYLALPGKPHVKINMFSGVESGTVLCNRMALKALPALTFPVGLLSTQLPG